ncbi:MAG: class I SAM-dependent methyltransferase [Candidatus Binatia bacterium]|nr:class I SAM-dependent methyltransferase [Candidatus Binatia bacterium]
MTDRLFQTTNAPFDLKECEDCGAYFLSPPPPPEELGKYYPKGFWRGTEEDEDGGEDLRGRLTEWYRRLILRDHARFVGNIAREQRAAGRWKGLLDVGCGDGSVLEAIDCRPCIGFDTADDAVRFVSARGFPAVRGVPDAMPFAPGSFSLVTMFHFLEHVRPAGPHLESARRLLSDGGELVVQVPNSGSWGASLLKRHWAGFDPPRHLINYAPKSLRMTLERAGFEVVAENHFCLRDNPATLANSVAPGSYPPARVARGTVGSGPAALLGDVGYLALTLAAIPFTLLESAAGHGESIMMRCRVAG